MVRIGGQELMVVSQYCDINLRPVPPGLVTVVRFCQEKQIPLILGADTNAHSTNWGPDQNPRGDDFDDFINRNQLHILNYGLKPTYRVYQLNVGIGTLHTLKCTNSHI